MSDKLIIIDGKSLADGILGDLKQSTLMLRDSYGVVPGLAVVQIGEDPASDVYVGVKETRALELGFHFVKHNFDCNASEEVVLQCIADLNDDPKINGIIVQLPIPQNFDKNRIIAMIDPSKDVDGLHPYNMGRLMQGDLGGFVPCTPQGIKLMLDKYDINLVGKNVLVIGASNLVGRPMSMLLLNAGATVTIAHSLTKRLPDLCKNADVLIVAIGDPEFIEGDWIKTGAVVIDVGINRMSDGNLVGDVQFKEAQNHAGYISPVPGGVGPMTVASLMRNTFIAAERSIIL